MSFASATDDETSRAWRARAQQATRNLAQPGLDACDIAREKAFASARETGGTGLRTFHLVAEIRGQSAHVAYTYRGASLASFDVVSLPGLWLARRPVGSKTLSILVAPANCAMDFCTTNPLVPGACPGDTLG